MLIAKLGLPDKYTDDSDLRLKAQQLLPFSTPNTVSYRAELLKVWAADIAKRAENMLEENTEDAQARYKHFIERLRNDLELLVDIVHGGYDSLKPAKSVERISS